MGFESELFLSLFNSSSYSTHSTAVVGPHPQVLNCAILFLDTGSECNGHYWTAGYYHPLYTIEFIWNVTSPGTSRHPEIAEMNYTHWEVLQTHSNDIECVYLYGAINYRWRYTYCGAKMCPICELDMI